MSRASYWQRGKEVTEGHTHTHTHANINTYSNCMTHVMKKSPYLAESKGAESRVSLSEPEPERKAVRLVD